MKNSVLRIGSRQSALAVRQAHLVGEQLTAAQKDLKVTYVGISTQGDRDAQSSLKKIGGKGVFVKEIESALIGNKIDVAVHSLKDVPQQLPAGLTLAAFPKREDPRDVLVSRFGEWLHELPRGSTIGTSSPRREAQIRNKFKDRYRVEPIRGNIDTRLKKVSNGDYDAIIMAAAGLKRMGLDSEVTQFLEMEDMLPAPGQGCLGLECRVDDIEIQKMIDAVKDPNSDIAARAERAFLQGCGGDCMVPLAGHAYLDKEVLIMRAMIFTEDGTQKVQIEEKGDKDNPELLGAACANRLLIEGGSEILIHR